MMASSNALVKNSDATSNSSSDKRLSLANIILIDWSRISVVDADADRELDRRPRNWEDIDENRAVWDSVEEVTIEEVGAETVGVVTLRLLCITSIMWMRVKLREWVLELDYVICHMVSKLTNLVMSWSQDWPGMQGMALYVFGTISVFGLAVT